MSPTALESDAHSLCSLNGLVKAFSTRRAPYVHELMFEREGHFRSKAEVPSPHCVSSLREEIKMSHEVFMLGNIHTKWCAEYLFDGGRGCFKSNVLLFSKACR